MRAEEFLEGWTRVSALDVTPTQRVWADRFCREGSGLLEFKSVDGDSYLVVVARDRAAARLLGFVVRKAFARERLEPIWDEAASVVADDQRADLANLGVLECTPYRIHDRSHVRRVYEHLTKVERHRLPSAIQWSASTGSLIRSLRRAVARADRETASQLLAELRSRGLTDQFHHCFLALWTRAKLEPASVADSEEIRKALGLVSPRIPSALLQVVADAVLRTTVTLVVEAEGGAKRLAELLRDGGSGLPSGLLDRASALDSKAGSAFRALASIQSDEWGLWEGDVDVLDEVLGGALIEELPKRSAPGSSEPVAVEGVAPVARYELFDRAEQELKQGRLAPETARLLDELHAEGQGYARHLLRAWWEDLDPAERADRASELGAFRAWLGDEPTDARQAPQSWLEWLECIRSGDDLQEVTRSGFTYNDLPLVADAADRASLAALNEALEALAGEGNITEVLEILPEIIDAWESSPLSPTESERLADAVGAVLQFGVLASENALSAGNKEDWLYRFLEVGIERGMSESAYEAVVGELAIRMEELQSVGLVGRLLDVFEFLTDSKRAHGESYHRLALGFSQALQRFHTRVDRDSAALVAEFLALGGLNAEAESLESLLLAEPVPEESQESGGVSVEGKKILIYTLVEPAGHRAKKKIESILKAEVKLNFDHAASASLKSGLEWADLVICVTRAAQHAATNVIDGKVQPQALIRPPGKGSSSIWNALSEWRQRQSV